MANFRRPLFAAAFVLAAGAASGTSATPVFLQSAGIYQPGTITVFGPGLNSDVYASAVEFVATPGASHTPVTLYAFCVDLVHEITVGIDSSHDIVSGAGDAQNASNLNYHTASLSLDSSGSFSGRDGVALSAEQIGEIGGLANLGRDLIVTDASDLSNKLAAVQGAIWSIEYPTSAGYSITAASSVVGSYLTGYVTQAASLTSARPIQAIYADNGASQGFAVGVPEPATWAMMIAGFGMVGFAARRRKPISAVAA